MAISKCVFLANFPCHLVRTRLCATAINHTKIKRINVNVIQLSFCPVFLILYVLREL